MMPSVYFHIDEVARDAVVASSLKSKLAAMGVSLVYGNRVTSPLLKRTDPFDLYVFPSVDLFKAFFPDLGRLRTPVVILPAESVGGLTSNLRRLGAKYFGAFPDECRSWTERVAAFCLWGPSHVKSFDEFGPHLLERVHVVGHPRFDSGCLGSMVRGDGPVRVGLISRFSGLNPFNNASMLANIHSGRRSFYRDGVVSPRFAVHADRDWEDYLYNEALDLRLLFEVVDALSERGTEIEIRVHPRENRSRWEALIAEYRLPITIAPWDMPFQHWASRMDHIVGPTSTSFFDCFAIGHRPICTNALAAKRSAHVIAGGDDDNPILKFVHMPANMRDLVDLASRKSREQSQGNYPPALAEILHQEAWYPECATALARIADICAREASGRMPGKARARALHRALSHAANMNQALRYGWRPSSEQSSSFLLTRSRSKWIDDLSQAPRKLH